MSVTLVLGGARSGKTRWAQGAAAAQAQLLAATPIMIATAQAFDDEMRERIARHQDDRGFGWRTIEAPIALEEAVLALREGEVAVVDCLTLWLSNHMLAEAKIEESVAGLLKACRECPASLYLVSNEVGLGIVPDNELARRFRDEAGRLNQVLAAEARRVMLLVAGLPMTVK